MKYLYIVLVLITSASSAFGLAPVMGSTEEDLVNYGKRSSFRAVVPFSPIDSEGNRLGWCTGSFVDVDGDIFFVTAGHCVKNAELVKLEYVDDEGPYLDYTLDGKAFSKNFSKPGSQHNLLGGLDLAFLPLSHVDLPLDAVPIKVYKGIMHRLLGERVACVGVSQLDDFISDLFRNIKCRIVDIPCNLGVRKATDFRIYAEGNSKLSLHPLNSKSRVFGHIMTGDSGGPVLWQDGKGNLFIVGVISVGNSLSDFEKVYEKLEKMMGEKDFKEDRIMDVMEFSGATSFIQFIEPGLLEKARFKMHGWLNAIEQRNEGLLLKAIEDGKLGLNHDSRGLLLKRAISNELWELAAELVYRGVSNVNNLEVVFLLGDKKVWSLFDAVVKLINSDSNYKVQWLNSMEHTTWNSLYSPQQQTLLRCFKSIVKSSGSGNREQILKDIKEMQETLGLLPEYEMEEVVLL